MRKQEEGEPAYSFITDLYCLAEHCGYGTLHHELIRDRLVVGLLNAPLSEKLQMDAELTLEKAITVVRQSEAVRKQQTVLRGQDSPRAQSMKSKESLDQRSTHLSGVLNHKDLPNLIKGSTVAPLSNTLSSKRSHLSQVQTKGSLPENVKDQEIGGNSLCKQRVSYSLELSTWKRESHTWST